MSPFDVPSDEMGRDPNIADEELQALLDGHPAVASDLCRFVDDLRATFPAGAPATEAHLAAIMETTQLFADNGDPVVRPASNADAPVAQVSRLPKRRENRMQDHKWRILVLRVAAPIVALFTVLGIMGSAGALPRGLQRLTSHAAGLVGFELPNGEDTEGGSDDQGENQDDQGEDTEKDDSAPVGEDDQGDDSQGDSVDATEGDQGDNSQGDAADGTEGDQGDNNDDQGDAPSDQGNQDDQGENDQGSTTNQDDQGDDSQDEVTGGSSQDDQGDNSGNSGSDDSGSGSSGSGSGDNQD
jgi:hypothetical protein